MEPSSIDSQKLLRNSLIGNAVFSMLSALAIVVSTGWLAEFLGLRDHVVLTVLAFSLAGYAVILLINARRPKIKIGDAWMAVILDAIWVIGSYALIFVVPFTFGGKWLIAAVAEIVFVFAILQSFGIRRVMKSEQAT
jgi:hypothetical protein